MATPDLSVREEICEYIKDTSLAAIIAGATYWVKPGLISRQRKPPGTYSDSELPRYAVIAGREVKTKEVSGFYDSRLEVNVSALIRGIDDGVDLDTLANRSAQDIETALFAEEYCGGLVIQMENVVITNEEGYAAPWEEITVTVTVHYRHAIGEPETNVTQEG